MQEDIRGLRGVNLMWISWCSHEATEDFLKFKGRLKPYLPANSITCNCRKAGIPQPPEYIRSGLDSGVLGFRVVGIFLFLSIRHDGVPFLRHSDSDEEDITFLESNVVHFGDVQDVL